MDLICPMCREEMKISSISNVARCSFCDAVISTSYDEDYYSNINNISFSRSEKNFSEGVYLSKQMIQGEKHDSLSCFLLFLSKYGIVYIRTPLYSKRVPSFSNNIKDIDFISDEDYLDAIKYSENEEIKNYYNSQANLIQNLYEKISDLTSRCKYNDIYVSAKRYNHFTDENGKTTSEFTEDYKKALETYDYLKKQGFNVFFSPLDAKNTIDEIEFSAIIHSNVYQSKVFLLFASELAYINTPSIKDDWFKYIYFMRQKMVPENSLIYAYKSESNKVPYIVPKELHSFKGFNYKDDLFFKNLTDEISKHIPEDAKTIQIKTIKLSDNETSVKSDTIITKKFSEEQSLSDEEKNIINLGLKSLRLQDFESAKEKFEQLLKVNDKNFMGYLGRFMSHIHATTLSDITSEKLLSVNDYSDVSKCLDYIDNSNGKKLIDRICLSLKLVDNPSKADNIVWIFYLIIPYIESDEQKVLLSATNNIADVFVRKNAVRESGKIFALGSLLSKDKNMENQKGYDRYIRTLMATRQFSVAKNVLIDYVNICENSDILLNLLKCTLKTNTFDNFVFNYHPKKSSQKNRYEPGDIVPRIITFAFYNKNPRALEEMRKLCYNQIEHYNLDSADKLISDILSYMLPLYPGEVVVKFLLKCANKFSNSGAFDLAIKYSKMVISLDETNCQAYFEILRANLKFYDDYDFVNYDGNIKDQKEYKNMLEVARKYNNTAFTKKIELLLTYQAKPKKMKTTKAFPRKNYHRFMFKNKFAKISRGLTILLVLAIIIIAVILLKK